MFVVVIDCERKKRIFVCFLKVMARFNFTGDRVMQPRAASYNIVEGDVWCGDCKLGVWVVGLVRSNVLFGQSQAGGWANKG